MNFNILIILFSFVVAFERISFTFFSVKVKPSVFSERSTSVPILTYALICLVALVDYFISPREVNFVIVLLGFLVFLIGALLRRGAVSCLGESWNIHVQPDTIKKIVTCGPYRYVRHPYYMAVILELIGFSLVANSYIACILVILIQLPILIKRVILEEKGLVYKFGDTYSQYKHSVPAFLPLKSKKFIL